MLSNRRASARLLALVGDNVALNERAEQLLAVATEQGFPVWHAFATFFHGWIKVGNGDVAEGLSLMRSGWTACRSTGQGGNMTPLIALLAGACEIAGQIEEAIAQLDEGFDTLDLKEAKALLDELT